MFDLIASFSLPQAKVTTELSQVLDEEEKRWMESLHIEEYQISLAKSVIQVLKHIVVMVTTQEPCFLFVETKVIESQSCYIMCVMNNEYFLQLQPKSTS